MRQTHIYLKLQLETDQKIAVFPRYVYEPRRFWMVFLAERKPKSRLGKPKPRLLLVRLKMRFKSG